MASSDELVGGSKKGCGGEGDVVWESGGGGGASAIIWFNGALNSCSGRREESRCPSSLNDDLRAGRQRRTLPGSA